MRRDPRDDDIFESDSETFSAEDYTVSGEEDVLVEVRRRRRRSRDRARDALEPVFAEQIRPAVTRGLTTCECTLNRRCARHASERLSLNVRDVRRERGVVEPRVRDDRHEIAREAFRAGFEAGVRAERELRDTEVLVVEREAAARMDRERMRVLERRLAGEYLRERDTDERGGVGMRRNPRDERIGISARFR